MLVASNEGTLQDDYLKIVYLSKGIKAANYLNYVQASIKSNQTRLVQKQDDNREIN
jgi:hypothetical protein